MDKVTRYEWQRQRLLLILLCLLGIEPSRSRGVYMTTCCASRNSRCPMAKTRRLPARGDTERPGRNEKVLSACATRRTAQQEGAALPFVSSDFVHWVSFGFSFWKIIPVG